MRISIRLAGLFLALTAFSFAGVNISAPANGAVTNSPLHVAATAYPANAASPIVAMQIYVNGGLVYNAPGSTVDTYINLGAGQFEVVVQAWDSAGASYTQPVYVSGSGAGVFVSSPGANAWVNGAAHVQATAASRNNITVMQVYDNGGLVNETPGSSVDTTLPLTPGSHYLVVQAWDAAGAVFLNPVIVNAPGAVEAAQAPPPPVVTNNAGGPQAYVAGNAIAKQDIDQMPGWDNCGACSGIGAKGPVVPYSMSEGVQNPSMDGKSAVFWIGGTASFGSAIWWKQLGGNDGITHFVYDLYFFPNNLGASQAMEFDVNHSAGGKKYIYGTECDIVSGHKWRVWDTINAHWMDTGASCYPNQNSWNHLTWELERVGDKTHFIAVTLNGYRQVVDKYYTAKPSGVHEINVAFQMDGNRAQDDYQVWLDKVSLYYW